MIIATAGHVDHGKTSLVNALTGIDTDRLAEEKQRGLTIDLGFAYTRAESGNKLGFVDVPGHIRFINNMLAGVAAIDHALLVIAADDGVMPQTREHFDILKLLGITSGTVAVTKIDRVDDEQLQSTLTDIESLVLDSFLEDAEVVPVSATTGDGIDMLRIALEIAADECSERSVEGQFRLAIDRRFSVKGTGIVVTGSVFSGTINVGDELLLTPQQLPVRIRGMHTQNEASESARTGDRAAINITGQGLELEDISRGNWLTTNTGSASSRADLKLHVLKSETGALRHWTPVHIHSGANHLTGRVALLESNRLAPGQEGLAQLVFEPDANLCVGDRVVIRDQAAQRTIGGGRVLDTHSPARGRAKPERISYLQLVDPANRSTSINRIISSSEIGCLVKDLLEKFNLTSDDLSSVIAGTEFVTLEDQLIITPGGIESSASQLLARVEGWHNANPGKSGLPRNQLRQQVRRWPASLFNHVVTSLCDKGELSQQGNLFQRKGFGVELNQQELAIWETALPLLSEHPTKPPVLHDLAKTLSIPPKQAEKILNQVIKTGQLVRPVKNRYFLPEGISQLKAALIEAADDKHQFTVQQYRDATGIGRNLCIEILEYFDRQGITQRFGDIRQIKGQQE